MIEFLKKAGLGTSILLAIVITMIVFPKVFFGAIATLFIVLLGHLVGDLILDKPEPWEGNDRY